MCREGGASISRLARRLEIFLDGLSALCVRTSGYLLSRRFTGLFSEKDIIVREKFLAFIQDLPEGWRDTTMGPQLLEFLQSLTEEKRFFMNLK